MPFSTPPLRHGLSWFTIFRLGLVQAAIGSVVVLTTSTLNRVMVVELALAAVIPGILVGVHYGVQLARPLWGHASDTGGRRSAFIIGGIAMLALGGTAAAASTLLFQQNFTAGFMAALVAFILIGIGIGASGTSLLALLASRTAEHRRPAAATLAWMLMIAGIVATAIISSQFLEPYSHARLITVTAVSGAIATTLAALCVWGVERRYHAINSKTASDTELPTDFRLALGEVWRDREARIFTIFVFFSMLAYQTQDLILEPFGGLLFAMSPAETTRLSGAQHGGVLLGMAVVGIAGTVLSARYKSILKHFTVVGCIASAIALFGLAIAAQVAPDWPLRTNIFLLGFANGVFAVAAIGTMMALAGKGQTGREGIRMGVWGAAQAVAFGLGGMIGTIIVDVSRLLGGSDATAFLTVFSAEAALFGISAVIAMAIGTPNTSRNSSVGTAKAPGPVQTLQAAE